MALLYYVNFNGDAVTYYGRDERDVGCAQETKKRPIIVRANARIKPHAMVIKSFDTLVALLAVFGSFLHHRLANIAKVLVLRYIFKFLIILFQFNLLSDYVIFRIIRRTNNVKNKRNGSRDTHYRAKYGCGHMCIRLSHIAMLIQRVLNQGAEYCKVEN